VPAVQLVQAVLPVAAAKVPAAHCVQAAAPAAEKAPAAHGVHCDAAVAPVEP